MPPDDCVCLELRALDRFLRAEQRFVGPKRLNEPFALQLAKSSPKNAPTRRGRERRSSRQRVAERSGRRTTRRASFVVSRRATAEAQRSLEHLSGLPTGPVAHLSPNVGSTH